MTTETLTQDVPDVHVPALQVGGYTLQNRLIMGTGGITDLEALEKALIASGTTLTTVAMRRYSPDTKTSVFSMLERLGIDILPNTAGCYTVKDTVLTAELAREALETDLIKVEVIADEHTLLPDVIETLEATEQLADRGFTPMVYTIDDPATALRLENAGAAAVMPLGAPHRDRPGHPEPAQHRAHRLPGECAGGARRRHRRGLRGRPGHGAGLRRRTGRLRGHPRTEAHRHGPGHPPRRRGGLPLPQRRTDPAP